MKSLTLTILIVAAFGAVSAKIEYKDCGSKVGKLLAVQLNPCKDSPCVLQKGNNYTINATFGMIETTDTAMSQISGIIDGVAVPFPINNPNACTDKNSGLKCPLENGKTYSYTTTIAVLSEYPDIKVIVKWQLMDASKEGNVIVCLETPVAITG